MGKVSRSQKLTIILGCMLFPAIANAQGSVSAQAITERERAALFPSAARIEEGRAVAEAACAGCHGVDGISQDGARPHLAGQRTIYLFREMLEYKGGRRTDSSMRKAVAFMDEESLLKTAIYYASLAPPFDSNAAAQSNIEDELQHDPLTAVASATAGCASCHGPGGNSTIPGMPSLTAQHTQYFTAAMKAYQGGDRTHNMMQMLVRTLDEETIRNMGIYYALQDPARKPSTVAGSVEKGADLAAGCTSCHGADGNAAAPEMPSLAGQDTTYLVQSMVAYQNGEREHDAMQAAVVELDEAELRDLAAYYNAQEPIARPVKKPLTAAQWLDRCDRCHGPSGNSRDPRYPSLAGQNRAYLESVLDAYASGERSDSIMHAMSEPLTDAVIARLAEYYSLQEPRSVVYFELPCVEEED